ncbi:MAG: G1 family glutamic endopeptidase [Streptosporangiaceae bacterium]
MTAAVAMAAASASASTATPAPRFHLHGFHLVTNARLPRTVLPHLASNATVDSQNWSGYAAVAKKNVALRYVQSTFTVPTVNCSAVPIGSAGQTYAAEWAGLDGFNSQTVEQTGVDSFCNSTTGAATNQAWYEMFPLDPVVFSGVSPGDTIFVAVYFDSSTNEYQLTLKDETTGSTMETNQKCPSGSACDRNSAEVIEEDPGGSAAGGINLADFGTARFNTSHVTARDGLRGTLSPSKLWTSTEIIMQDSSGNTMATPSALTNSGANFSVTWDLGT